MALGFAILAGIMLLVIGVAGLGYYGVPIGLVGMGAFVAFAIGHQKKKAGAGAGSESAKPQDEAGGPTHKREEYAHNGQAYMTPEQMRRSRA